MGSGKPPITVLISRPGFLLINPLERILALGRGLGHIYRAPITCETPSWCESAEGFSLQYGKQR